MSEHATVIHAPDCKAQHGEYPPDTDCTDDCADGCYVIVHNHGACEWHWVASMVHSDKCTWDPDTDTGECDPDPVSGCKACWYCSVPGCTAVQYLDEPLPATKPCHRCGAPRPVCDMLGEAVCLDPCAACGADLDPLDWPDSGVQTVQQHLECACMVCRCGTVTALWLPGVDPNTGAEPAYQVEHSCGYGRGHCDDD